MHATNGYRISDMAYEKTIQFDTINSNNVRMTNDLFAMQNNNQAAENCNWCNESRSNEAYKLNIVKTETRV